MMRLQYIVVCLFACFSSGCDTDALRQQQAKVIDSVSALVVSAEKQLGGADSADLMNMYSQYKACRSFIEQNVRDTINRDEARQLQLFEQSGRQLEAFIENRKRLAARSEKLSNQLNDLKKNAVAGTLEGSRLLEFLKEEKTAATEYVSHAKNEFTNMRAAMEQFINSLPAVQELIRERNNGLLPVVVNNTVSQ